MPPQSAIGVYHISILHVHQFLHVWGHIHEDFPPAKTLGKNAQFYRNLCYRALDDCIGNITTSVHTPAQGDIAFSMGYNDAVRALVIARQLHHAHPDNPAYARYWRTMCDTHANMFIRGINEAMRHPAQPLMPRRAPFAVL